MRSNLTRILSLVALLVPPLTCRAEEPRDAKPSTVSLPHGAVARLGDARFVHGERLIGLSLSPDGSKVLGVDWKHIYLWDAKTGCQLRRFEGIESIQVAALSPDGKTVAAVENGPHVYLWDAATGRELHRLKGDDYSRPDAMCWSPDGNWIASSTGNSVLVWQAADGKLIHKLSHAGVTALAVSPDRKLILTGSHWDNTFRLWDVDAEKELRQFEGGAGTGNVAFAPDGKTVVGYCEERGGVTRTGMRTWDVATGARLRRDFAGGWHAFGGFSADGKTVYAARNGYVHVWDTKTREEVRKWKAEYGIENLSLSGDGKWLAGDAGGRIRIWEVATGKERHPPAGHALPVLSVSFAPDGKTVASASRDGTVRVWDWAAGRELWKHANGDSTTGARIVHSPNGKWLVTFVAWTKNGVWRIRDSATGRVVSEFEGDQYARDLVFDLEGQAVLTAGHDGCIGVWDPSTGKQLRRIELHLKRSEDDWWDEVTSLCPSPDGRRVAWTAYSLRAGVVDLETGKPVLTLRAPEGRNDHLERIACSPDGTCLATGSRRGHLRLWHPTTGKQLAEWLEAPGGVLAFSPDGRFIAVAASDTLTVGKDIAVWDVAARKELVRFQGHLDVINQLAFEPRGRVLVSASADGTLLAWDLTGALKGANLPNRKLADAELRMAWEELDSTDPKQAQRAVATLACAAPASVAFIENRLKPSASVDPKCLAALVADLGAEDFKVREKASRELGALGEVAEIALRRAAKSDSPEVRDRAVALLRSLEQWGFSADQVRAIRAVAALEYAGGSEARRLLLHLAGGDPAARLTRHARAASQRLLQAESKK